MKKDYILITSGEAGGIGIDLIITMMLNYYTNTNVQNITQSKANNLLKNKDKLQNKFDYTKLFNNNVVLVVLGDIQLFYDRLSLLQQNHTHFKDSVLDFVSIFNDNKYIDCIELNNYLTHDFTKIKNIFSSLKTVQTLCRQVYFINVKCADLNTTAKALIENAPYVLNTLDMAILLAKHKLIDKLLTMPINKEVINQYYDKYNTDNMHPNQVFMGHTEYLAQNFASNKVVMMLANTKMKVALLTTHIPLSKITQYVNADNLSQTILLIHNELQNIYNINNPKIAVCGLNPHAGEGGYIGDEEIRIINPIIKLLQHQGINVTGAHSADTIFNSHLEYDVILAMYHDQGLPVLKYSDFTTGINVTLGLPIRRVSVDHGTAFDIVTKNTADLGSTLTALQFLQHGFINRPNISKS